MAMEKFLIFVLENSKISYNGYNLVTYYTLYMLSLFILLFVIQNRIHQKNNKM